MRNAFIAGFSVVMAACVLGSAGLSRGRVEQRPFEALWSQFQSVDSLHFRADVTIEFLSPAGVCPSIIPGVLIAGHVEHWSAGERYRFNSFAEPEKYPGINTQVAFDGDRFQLLHSTGTLSFSTTDSDALLPTLPDPIMELMAVLHSPTDRSQESRLRFKDIAKDSFPDSLASVTMEEVRVDGAWLQRATLAGARHAGTEYVRHVYFASDSEGRPVRIDRVTLDGRILTSSEFSDYFVVQTENGPTYWPRTVVLRAFDESSNVAGTMAFTINEFSVNAAFPKWAFSIKPNANAGVWDDDRQAFVSSS